ncbi:CHAT domain-containing protein [Mastigocoleus sp. MO_188.B34]|uniref:CHAT domain-containing protein n=1 Tax=Mastigocoleus sp. MO_188.B34 TaxID=3036635 RepID=UPI002621E4CC|nr:CHAT domain-containing protein [Mastigocoleus sp. MO_188.B34]MDJ0696269.1 CHAT domain-containing protein [Mastigocoleus sp. MO_188.B34]
MSNKILILAANPFGDLNLSREIRDIREGLRRSAKREEFELEQREALRPQDLQRALLEVDPRIVHFCGHGSGSEGLVLESNEGQQHLVTTEAIAGLFKLFTNRVECILLNACYSQVQAEAIVKHINYVIGMSQDVRDDAAIAFTVGFYEALGSGETIKSAYEFGCNRIQLEVNRSTNYQTGEPFAVPEHLIPILLKNPNPVAISSPVEEKLEIPSPGNSNMTKVIQIQDKRRSRINFEGYTTVIGDVVARDKIIKNTTSSKEGVTKCEVVQLLEKLKALIKEADFDDDEKDIATGRVAAAIIEAKNADGKNPQEVQEKIDKYLAETKTILEQVTNMGETGSTIFPIMDEITKL